MSASRALAAIVMALGTHACFMGHPGMAKERISVKKGYAAKKDFSAILGWTQGPLKLICFIHALVEVTLILGTYESFSWIQPAARYLLPGKSIQDFLVLSPAILIASALVGFGGTLRYLCFREMGSNFTYTVTVLEDHRLTTSGPYSLVRHPSYTALSLVHIGCLLWFSASGTWLGECGVFGKLAVRVVLVPLVWRTFAVFQMFWRRIPVEDRLMKKQFGSQWDAWAAKVPYRLIPGIY